MLLKDDGLRHARVLYTEGIQQLEANPSLMAENVSLQDAKWNVVACCLDLKDGFVEAWCVKDIRHYDHLRSLTLRLTDRLPVSVTLNVVESEKPNRQLQA